MNHRRQLGVAAGALALAAIFVVGRGCGSEDAARPDGLAPIVPPAQGAYFHTTLFSAGYGAAQAELGYVAAASEILPSGPTSFAVVDGTVYILDRVKGRVAKFDMSGNYVGEILRFTGTDFAVTPGGSIVEFDAANDAVIEHDSAGLPGKPQPMRLSAGETGSVLMPALPSPLAPLLDPSTRTFAPSGASQWTLTKSDDHAGTVKSSIAGSTFQVTTGSTFGSMGFIGTDRAGNLFLRVEQLTGVEPDVIVEVRKYATDGTLLATMPIDFAYAVQPVRDVVVDDLGNVYQLRPLATAVVVEKWSMNAQ